MGIKRLIAVPVLASVIALGSTIGSGASAQSDKAGEPTRDEITPLIVSSLGSPIPVKGTDNRFHVAYELQVLNASPRPAVLETIETVDATTDDVVATLDATEIAARVVRVGPLLVDVEPTNEIAAGDTVAILLDDVYDTRREIPRRFSHRFVASFGPPAPGLHPVAEQYPGSLDATIGTVELGTGRPLRIAPPLAGDGWLAVNACCTLSSHRAAIMPFTGRLNATERYAIDWIRVDPSRIGAPDVPEGFLPSFVGDPSDNTSFLAYDEPLLAVADATVVDVVDALPDSTPLELPTGLTIPELGGNYVILDLGRGYFALYGHAKPGSVEVKKGDRVEQGQEIARLGNSGNSSEAHLHFHVMRGPTPLAATNWPYEISRFDVAGTLGETGVTPEPKPGSRRDELPLALNMIEFPAAS